MKYLLTDVTGIGESTAALMLKHGIDSVKTLCESDVEKVCLIPGFGAIRAAATLNAAAALQGSDDTSEGADVKRRKTTPKPTKSKAGKVKKAPKPSKKDNEKAKQSKKTPKKTKKEAELKAAKAKKVAKLSKKDNKKPKQSKKMSKKATKPSKKDKKVSKKTKKPSKTKS